MTIGEMNEICQKNNMVAVISNGKFEGFRGNNE